MNAPETTPDDENSTEPPRVFTRGAIKAVTPDGTKLAARWGEGKNRDGRVIVAKKDSQKHRLRALDAYAFSTDAIRTMEQFGAERVFIHETDTGDVYEFSLDDFTDWGTPVPAKFLDSPDDPQRYHERDDPLHRWPGHGEILYAGEACDGSAEFVRGSEL